MLKPPPQVRCTVSPAQPTCVRGHTLASQLSTAWQAGGLLRGCSACQASLVAACPCRCCGQHHSHEVRLVHAYCYALHGCLHADRWTGSIVCIIRPGLTCCAASSPQLHFVGHSRAPVLHGKPCWVLAQCITPALLTVAPHLPGWEGMLSSPKVATACEPCMLLPHVMAGGCVHAMAAHGTSCNGPLACPAGHDCVLPPPDGAQAATRGAYRLQLPAGGALR